MTNTYAKEKSRQTMMIALSCVINLSVKVFEVIGFVLGAALLSTGAVWGIGFVALGIEMFAEVYEKAMTYKLKDEGHIATRPPKLEGEPVVCVATRTA